MDRPDKQAQVDAIAGELLHDREGSANAPQEVVDISRARHWLHWAMTLLSLGIAAASITLCRASHVDLIPPKILFLALIGIWPVWLCTVLGALWLTPRIKSRGAGQTMRWKFMRWSSFLLLLFGPFLGQLNALVLGIVTLREKDLETRRVRRPTALVYFCIALGWPGMFVAAIYALAPLFASVVHLGGPNGPTMPVDMDLTYHAGPLSSLYLVYGSAGVLACIVTLTALVLWRHQRRRAKQAFATSTGSQILEAGETVVRGTVAYAAGNTHAVRIEIDQNGNETESSGSWSHSWTETNRRVLVAPFYLEHASGERIRVEPTQEVHLMDDLDGVILVDLTKRQRFAELIPGEQVIATGHLRTDHDPEAGGGGYRGGGQGWILKPPKGSTMLLSTKPLDAPFRRRARNYAIMAIVVATIALIGQVLHLPYHIRVFAGEAITATVVNRHITTSTYDDGDSTYSYHVGVAASAPPLTLIQEVGRGTYSTLVEGSIVPVVYDSTYPPMSQLGHVPQANGIIALILALLVTVLSVFFIARGETGSAWYDQPKIVDHGSGKLPRPQTPPEDSAQGLTDLG